MPKVMFIYKENKYNMILKDKISEINIFNEYSQSIDVKLNDLLFLYKGKNIALWNSQIINNLFKSKKNIIILVYNININYKIDNISDNIICPDCKNLTFLNFNDNNINNCKNNHENVCSNEYTSITEFMDNQIIDKKEIKCSICNNNKNLYGLNFYSCSCKAIICQLCIEKHQINNNHKLIFFDKRYTICNKHLIEFVSYCLNCNLNLCEKCEEDHENHKNKIIIFKRDIPNKERLNEIKKEI